MVFLPLEPDTPQAQSSRSPTADLAVSRALSSPLVCLNREEQLLLSQECDDTSAHRWIDCSFTGSLCGTSTQNDAVTASCVGFNTDKISCPYLWFL